MGFRELDVVGFLESAWGALEAKAGDWLDGLLRAVRPALDQGLGVHGYFVDASGRDGFAVSGYRVAGSRDATAAEAAFRAWDAALPATVKRRVHTFAPFGTASTLPRDLLTADEVAVVMATRPHVDVLGVNGLDATGRGCAVAAMSERPIPLPDHEPGELWARVAVHLASAARLRARQGGGVAAESEAVLEPTGRCVHATGDAREREAREALRDGVVRIDRARGRRRGASGRESLSLWQALVAGRWSLVDRFEADGRRYVVAFPNRPEVARGEHLTPTEARIMGAMEMGHTNKVIAYELGMAPSTVATHIARAAAKLGARGRGDLLERLAGEPGTRAKGRSKPS